MADDFGGGEISAPAIESAGAKTAPVGTTDLAGDADCEAGTAGTSFAEGGWDENGFDERSIAKFPEKLSGGVLGSLDGDGFCGTESEAGSEGGAEWEGEVGHFIVRGDEALEDPGTNLFFAIGLVAREIPCGHGLIEEEG